MNKLKWKKCTAVLMSFVMLLCAGVTGAPRAVGDIVDSGRFSATESKAETDYGLRNPRVEMLTRDVIEFGSYWQEEYTPKMKIDNPVDGEVYTDLDGTEMIYLEYTLSEYDDSLDKYVDVDYNKYFKKSPIKWQILEEKDTDGDGVADDLFLMADQVLDCKPYNEVGIEKKYSDGEAYMDYSCTWETSTIRTWLNETFYEDNFSDNEKN